MAIDIGINKKDREQISRHISKLLADTYSLYLKTHCFHWNVTGPHFSSLHIMFETQYNQLWTAADEIAERIRALGIMAPGSYSRAAGCAAACAPCPERALLAAAGAWSPGLESQKIRPEPQVHCGNTCHLLSTKDIRMGNIRWGSLRSLPGEEIAGGSLGLDPSQEADKITHSCDLHFVKPILPFTIGVL